MDCFICVAIIVGKANKRHFGKIRHVEIVQERIKTAYLLQSTGGLYVISVNSGDIIPGDVPEISWDKAIEILAKRHSIPGNLERVHKIGITKAHKKVSENGDPDYRIPKRGFCLKKSPSEAGRKKAA